MNLSPEELLKNFNKLIKAIEISIQTPEKRDALIALHKDWEVRISTAPASTKKSYHNAFVGGYVLHVLNVMKGCSKILESWKSLGFTPDFTEEEMYFSAVCHDLGKIGDENNDYYIPCEEQWLTKKGQLFVLNPALQFMKVAERSLMTLHNRGIKVTEKEYLAIKLHDGLYEDSNKPYLISYSEDYELRTMLPHILHQADLMSGKIEELNMRKK